MTTGIDTQLKAGTWAIDPLHSSINFSIRHLVVGKVRGRFSEFSGSITVPDNGIPSVSATIAVGSVDNVVGFAPVVALVGFAVSGHASLLLFGSFVPARLLVSGWLNMS